MCVNVRTRYIATAPGARTISKKKKKAQCRTLYVRGDAKCMYKLGARKRWVGARTTRDNVTRAAPEKTQGSCVSVSSAYRVKYDVIAVRRESSPRVILSFIYICIRCISYTSFFFFSSRFLFYRICIQGVSSLRNFIRRNMHSIGFIKAATDSIMRPPSRLFFFTP